MIPTLWVLADSGRLSPSALAAYRDPGVETYFSAAGLWEIGSKISLGKLVLHDDWVTTIARELKANAIRWLPIEPSHCATVASLPFHHRDPFDRMLIAQAQVEGLAVLTADGSFVAYEVRVIW